MEVEPPDLLLDRIGTENGINGIDGYSQKFEIDDDRQVQFQKRSILMDWEIIGYAAAALTMFGFLPQLVKMARTKSVDDVSLVMMVQMGLGVFLWLVYGLHLKNSPLIVANVVSLAILILGLFAYFRYTTRRYFR